MQQVLQILSMLVNADKIGGWVRAGIASLFPYLLVKFPALTPFLSDAVREAISVIATTVAVGLWSQLVKSDSAKVQMAAEVPSVTQIKVNDANVAAGTSAPEVQLTK